MEQCQRCEEWVDELFPNEICEACWEKEFKAKRKAEDEQKSLDFDYSMNY